MSNLSRQVKYLKERSFELVKCFACPGQVQNMDISYAFYFFLALLTIKWDLEIFILFWLLAPF
jgi:hypothetical protein